MENWIDLFKIGTHTDASGNAKEWTASELQTIADKYNGQEIENKHKAPAIAGEHLEDKKLIAYGWVKELKFENNHLWGLFEKIDPDFKAMVNDGKFNTVSIALYPDLLLQHVAFLGAIPPAVKGLKAPKFSDEGRTITTVTYQKSKNYQFNEKGGKMTLDEFIKALVDAVKATDGDEVAGNVRATAEKMKDSVVFTAAKVDGKEPEQQFSESPELKRIAQLEMQLYNQKNDSFFSEMIKSGRLLPKQLPALETILNGTFNDNRKLQFSEGKSLSIADAVKEFVRSMPENYSMFSEIATADKASSTMADLDKFIAERNKL